MKILSILVRLAASLLILLLDLSAALHLATASNLTGNLAFGVAGAVAGCLILAWTYAVLWRPIRREQAR